ncbi:MAG TPA: hypothetical protein DEF07_01330 [Nitrosomonas sp.]|nr:hypothetical protein [Nitrosomonas sp.]HNO75920.1 hypothetical protein [Nitrosomonas mobilis]
MAGNGDIVISNGTDTRIVAIDDASQVTFDELGGLHGEIDRWEEKYWKTKENGLKRKRSKQHSTIFFDVWSRVRKLVLYLPSKRLYRYLSP